MSIRRSILARSSRANAATVTGRGNVVSIASDHGSIRQAALLAGSTIDALRRSADEAARRELDFRSEAGRREADLRGDYARREADIRSESGRREEALASLLALTRTATGQGAPVLPRDTAESINRIADSLSRPALSDPAGDIPRNQALSLFADAPLNQANRLHDEGEAAPAAGVPDNLLPLAAAAARRGVPGGLTWRSGIAASR